ncbi:hypothetical protein KSP39_PZI014168 [Platanthera zijinensis]|uniref:Uncharacterized protein n=1 Tax=Platanthera zijinensis TaxID=2320716 RepID=A0AAP0G3R1_9ASPA
MCKCRSHGTFPNFVLQSSHLNICYYHQYPHQRPLPMSSRPEFHSIRRALLLIKVWHLPRWPGVGRVHAHTQTLHIRSRSVGSVPHKRIPLISFLAPYGLYHPSTLMHVSLLSQCFKTG